MKWVKWTSLATAAATAMLPTPDISAVSPRGEQLAVHDFGSNIAIPLPVVARTSPAGSNPFDAASLVVLARIRERTVAEEVDFEGQSLGDGSTWTYAMAHLMSIELVNERRPEDPVMRTPFFLIEQKKRKRKPIPFQFGRLYLLLLKPSKELMMLRASDSTEPEPYELSAEQGGFEVTGSDVANMRLRVLVRGGPLDAYNGRLVRDVLRAVRKKVP